VRKSRIYLALLHYPMYNKRGEIITTSITNLDLHDISRAARTYGAEGFFVVHPSPKQQGLLQDIMGYWQAGYGAQYNPDREQAFSILKPALDLLQVMDLIEKESGCRPSTVATDAKVHSRTTSYLEMKKKIQEEEQSFLLLFGTGWGISQELMQDCDYILEPVQAGSDYNHLSVRSAVSIILDRLLGECWFEA
jgi:hypothetical protein